MEHMVDIYGLICALRSPALISHAVPWSPTFAVVPYPGSILPWSAAFLYSILQLLAKIYVFVLKRRKHISSFLDGLDR
jgi:hypothetical protein